MPSRPEGCTRGGGQSSGTGAWAGTWIEDGGYFVGVAGPNAGDVAACAAAPALHLGGVTVLVGRFTCDELNDLQLELNDRREADGIDDAGSLVDIPKNRVLLTWSTPEGNHWAEGVARDHPGITVVDGEPTDPFTNPPAPLNIVEPGDRPAVTPGRGHRPRHWRHRLPGHLPPPTCSSIGVRSTRKDSNAGRRNESTVVFTELCIR